MRTYARLLLLVLLIAPERSAASSSADAYQQARLDYFALRKDDARRPYRHHWMNVIRGLDRGAEKLRGDVRCGALFNAGRAWQEVSEISYLQDDRDEAIGRYAKLVELCPKSQLADDALFHAAELQQKRDKAAARRSLDRLLASYGGGDRADEARALQATLPPVNDGREAAAKQAAAEKRAAAAKQAAAEKRAAASKQAAAEKRAAASKQAEAEKRAAAAKQAAAGDRAVAATQPSAAAGTTPAPRAAAAPTEDAMAGGGLPSAVDILAALDARGADSHRPEDVALAEDLRRDRLARGAPEPASAAARNPPAPQKAEQPELDRERLARMADSTGGEIPLSLAAGLKVRRVVIDPGHGGKDTGAIGRKGTREKDLTLAISKKLKARLEALGLEVFLTREKDVFVELEERTRFANGKNADLFISVHVNAAENRKAHGIETYTLNLNSDRYAMRLAARENATSKRGVGDLQFILADLATKANTDDSVRLARLVQSEMVDRLRQSFGKQAIRDLGVKQALFYVLVGAKMPAILVEASFVSNAEEEKRLRTEKYKDEAARSIAEGVRRFISEREAFAQGGGFAGASVF